jgi:hypothetical protein
VLIFDNGFHSSRHTNSPGSRIVEVNSPASMGLLQWSCQWSTAVTQWKHSYL